VIIYKPARGMGLYNIAAAALLYNVLLFLGIIFVNSYIVSSLLKIFIFLFNIYMLYYAVRYATMKYSTDENYLYISDIFRKVKIPFSNIEAYHTSGEEINGIRLSGFCTKRFSIGKSFIHRIGTTNMYVTAIGETIYLKVGETSYAISPMSYEKFEKEIAGKGIEKAEWEFKWTKTPSLHKDKSFMRPFFVVSLIIVILTINPLALYLMDMLPHSMPLSFDASFQPLEMGTGKQFAFNQMVNGVLNMAILFCMYYASFFYAKYDRKSVNKFIYSALIISAAFLLIQLRIIYVFS
jgi:hypothetical protein